MANNVIATREATRRTHTYSFHREGMIKLGQLGGLITSHNKTVFTENYGNILTLLYSHVDEWALSTLLQFYDPDLRCFTFSGYQLAPTLEEYSHFLNIKIQHKVPFVCVPEEPDLDYIANALYLSIDLALAPNSSSSGSFGNWLFENKEHRKNRAATSLGMILLWDFDSGLAQLAKYFHSNDNHVIAGALLGIGMVNCSIKNDCDPVIALLGDYIDKEDSSNRTGAIMGLGIAFAGSQNEQLRYKLAPILSDPKASLDVIAFTTITLGLIYVGSCNEEVSRAIIFTLMDRSELELGDPLTRLLPLGLGLLYIGKQESVDLIYFGLASGSASVSASGESLQKSLVIPSVHFASVTDIAWGRSGDYIISASHGQTPRIYTLWKVEAPQKDGELWYEISRPQVHGHDINRMTIVGGADEKVARVFEALLSCLKTLSNAILDKSCDRKIASVLLLLPM